MTQASPVVVGDSSTSLDSSHVSKRKDLCTTYHVGEIHNDLTHKGHLEDPPRPFTIFVGNFGQVWGIFPGYVG